MSGNTKDKIAVRNNAGKTNPDATAPMANVYANAIKTPRLIAEKESEPSTHTARSLCSERALAKLGRYVATEHAHSSVTMLRPSTHTARSLRSDRACTQLGRYVATEHAHGSVAT
ncbi:hypothetical protein DY000_02029705 [Brassica cretica]|uniref:BURP domain-containing protein n=1 Tax=Brassica cretica TaxID=69181 RepID=A0ABQ7DP94_BRACR|nr:hypothetical protein DY000_02029705 [Brassica cretica]